MQRALFDDLYDTELYIKNLVMMHDYDKWDNGTYKGNMHTVVPSVMEVVEQDKIKTLINFGKWYGLDEMQRDKPETWKSIVDRFLTQQK